MFNSCEDVSYLLPEEEYTSHSSQKGERIRMMVFFAVSPDPERRDRVINPVELRYVKIPANCPAYRVRHLLKEVEKKLIKSNGNAKKLPLIYTKREDEMEWSLEDSLPVVNVVFY